MNVPVFDPAISGPSEAEVAQARTRRGVLIPLAAAQADCVHPEHGR